MFGEAVIANSKAPKGPDGTSDQYGKDLRMTGTAGRRIFPPVPHD